VKDDDPFEYPDDNITEPSTVTHLVRRIQDGEGWTGDNSEAGCQDDLPTIDYALYDLTFSRGFATLHLKPDTTTCVLYAGLSSPFNVSEIASDYWDNWKLEFTYSELRLPETAEVWIDFKYREVAFELDIAPHLREILQIDSNFTDADGVFSFSFEEGFTDFQLNGVTFQPDFGAESGNTYMENSNHSDHGLTVSLNASGTANQTLLVFNFVRVTSFGIPE
jgi:hypothetical protein